MTSFTFATTYTKTVFSLTGGVVFTFASFALMQHLISQERIQQPTDFPIVDVSFITPPEETKTNEIDRRPPAPPKVNPMPPRPQEPSSSVDITNDTSLFTFDGVKVTPSTEFQMTQPSDTQANAIVRVQPSYPAAAARDGIEGWVKLTFSISPTGEVIDAQVIASEPSKIFDREALKALKRWKYRPQVQNGVAVTQSGQVVVLDFSLDR